MLVNLTMFPTDKRGGSASADVARVIDIIDRSGLPYQLTAMSTLIEGPWDKVMATVNKARLMLRRRHSRVYIILTIDDRKGARSRITGKVRSVEKHLGREVSK
jgi:uncharacterized protein (TIGR00106 family)